jgi:hypothetical protein
MRKLTMILVGVFAACGGGGDAPSVSSTSAPLDAAPGKADPPMRGIVWARGTQAAAPGGQSPDLIYHGGLVMTGGAYVEAIFWGPSWTPGDEKSNAMGTFYSGLGNTSYEATNTEYTQTGALPVGTTVTLPTTWSHFDPSPAPKTGNKTSAILAEVCKLIKDPRPDGFYPVYVDSTRHGSYCAYHSSATCNGVTIQFAFFYNLDNDPGCDPQDTTTGNSEPVAALGNVSGHEISEALTDPHLDAWYDSTGEENADKCAWTFGPSPLPFTNRSLWKIQGNWSNNAYDANLGYVDPSAGRVQGCVDGTNPLVGP